MLLTYLFSNFDEESEFADRCGIAVGTLHEWIERRVGPAASYVYESNGQSRSFVSTHVHRAAYRFHLKGHQSWFAAVDRYELSSEDRAREYFEARFDQAKVAFLSSPFGRELSALAPDVCHGFDADHMAATWTHFLNGVYGVCTRDGLPETVFLKQAGVMFIDRIIEAGPGSLSSAEIALLDRAVTFLDEVESDFAPHEVAQSSRQRCIIEVRSSFLFRQAA